MSNDNPPTKVASMEGLGPLPKEVAGYMRGCNQDLQDGDLLFTAAQMHAYALQERATERERCAHIAKRYAVMASQLGAREKERTAMSIFDEIEGA